jgi:hypothetical protein
MSIFSDGTANITQCYGQLAFGSGDRTFASSNAGSLINKCLFQVSGDINLGGNAQFQVYDTEQFIAQTAGYTLTANTSAQALFNATAAGTLTVPAGYSYFFECVFSITGLSASAHTVNFTLGGTATYTSVGYQALTATAAGGAVSSFQGTAATATAICASTTTTVLQGVIKGIIRVNAAGTIIPQVTQVTNSAAGVVGTNSYFRVWPAGSNSVNHAGPWT